MHATNDAGFGRRRTFLDTASGLPLHPAARPVLEAAVDQGWADPLRLHKEGREAALLLDNAREVVAWVLGARPDEVSFVSSGTTACQLGVLGLRRGRRRIGGTVVHSAVEHSAVLLAGRHESDPATADLAPAPTTISVGVDRYGRVDLDAWQSAVESDDVALACLQAANPEVGTVQPLEEARELCRRAEVPLSVDACAAVGWMAPPSDWDVLAASAHKWGGPAGVGVLAVRSGVRWRAPWPVDERGRAMGGYVDVPRVLAAAAALQAVDEHLVDDAARMRAATSRLRRRLAATIPDLDLAGDPESRLPHVLNLSCLYLDGEALVTELDRAGFAVSSGSACTSSSLEPSHVLAAMGVLTHGNVRVSISPDTSDDDLDRFADALAKIVARLRSPRLRSTRGARDHRANEELA